MDAQGHVTPEEIREALLLMYRGDIESNPQQALLQLLADDLRPKDERGRWRPSPLLILIAFLACALIAIFFYFTFGARP